MGAKDQQIYRKQLDIFIIFWKQFSYSNHEKGDAREKIISYTDSLKRITQLDIFHS